MKKAKPKKGKTILNNVGFWNKRNPTEKRFAKNSRKEVKSIWQEVQSRELLLT